MFKWIIVSIVVTLLSGCSNPLTDYVNKRFPPVSMEQQQQLAIDSSVNSLTNINDPNVAFGVSLNMIENSLLTQKMMQRFICRVTSNYYMPEYNFLWTIITLEL